MLSALTNIASFGRDPIGFLLTKRNKFGNTFPFRLGPLPITFFCDPLDVERIYSNPKAFQRSNVIGVIGAVTGDSILISTGEAWKKKRLAAQPVFQPSAIAALFPLMSRLAEKRMNQWEARCHEPIDMRQGAIDLTLEVVTEALFGHGIDTLPPDFHSDLETIFDVLRGWIENPFSLPAWVPTPLYRKFHRAMKDLNKLTYGLIDGYIERGGEGSALLAILLRSLRRPDGSYDREAARNEVITYFLAGFETTATTLSWIIYELARKPHYAQAIRDEALPSSPEGFAKMVWPSRVVRETLRLHPPAWVLDFIVSENAVIGDKQMRKGQHIWISQYLTQRHPDFWPQPDEFLPERFNEDEDRKRHKYAFFPFGAGARHCIGQGFAMLELQLVVTLLCKRFRWRLVDDKPVPHMPGFVLRAGGPIRCQFEPLTSAK